MITPYTIASKFVGIKEVPGKTSNPQILAMLQLDDKWPADDETPWCSAFVNYVCWLCDLPRSKKLNARSWIGVGRAVTFDEAQRGDIVVLSRGTNPAQGHVGFYHGHNESEVFLLGGNQGDTVNISEFDIDRVLQIVRVM